MTQLPAHWKVRPLEDIADVRLGRQRSPKNHQGTQMRPYLRAANVTWSGLALDDVKSMNFTDAEMETYSLRPDDVLLSEASGSPDEVGKPALWTGEISECAFQNTLVRVRPLGPEPWYLLHYFRHLALSGQFAANARGVGIHHLGRARLAAWPVPLPPLDEQRKIAALVEEHVSHIDAAGGLVSKVTRRLAALRRSMLRNVIGNPDRKTIPLGQLVERVEAGKSFGGSAAPASADQWGVIKVSAMTWGEFRPDENKAVSADRANPRYEIRPGDLLVSRANTGEYVGASVLVQDVRPRLLLSDKSLRLVLRDGVSARWLWFALSSPDTRKQISAKATGTKDSMRNISQPALLSVEVPDVPLDQQREEVGRLTTYFTAVTALAKSLDAAQRRQLALRRALLEAAFSGRLTGRCSDMDLVEEMAGV